MRILVIGILPHESGKTTLAKALVSELVSRGLRVGVSKPVAGHNLWYQKASFDNSRSLGILVGEDAVELKRSSGSEDLVEAINPFDVALAPPDPDPYLRSLRSYIEILSSPLSTAVMARVSICSGDRIYSEHYIIEARLSKLPDHLRELVVELYQRLKPKPVPARPEGLERIMALGSAAAEECYKALSKIHQNLVIESFNNAASPVQNLDELDTAIAVSPGKIYVYEGQDYLRALHAVSSVRSPAYRGWWPSTSEVLGLIQPRASMAVPLSWNIQRFGEFSERLADLVLKTIPARSS